MAEIKNKVVDPLVSVCIITYNSANFIIDALNSVYNQTYQNIELIVTDDGSKDDTVKITKEWLQKREGRFVEVKVLTVEKNTGTTKNSNRGLRASKGELFKYFAGDDVLLPDAIENYVAFIKDRSEIKWVYAKAIRYNKVISENSMMKVWNYEKLKTLFEKDKTDQFRRLVIQNFLWYPTHFFRKSVLIEIGGFDESFGVYEDYPTWLRLYRNGEQCYFMDEYTLGYRYTDQSVVNNPGFLRNRNIRKLAFVARKRFAFDKLTWVEKFGTYMLYGLEMFLTTPYMNKATKNRIRINNYLSGTVRRMCYFLQRIVKL